MIVPQYWSESKTKRIVNGRQFTIKRFGWSDISEQAAKEHAQARVAEAVEILEKEGDVRRIDHKLSYNGAEGIPIREEVVSRHEEVIVSRNSYGALCLNTPDVLFADIDFAQHASFKVKASMYSLFSVCAILLALSYQSWLLLLFSCFMILIFTPVIADIIHAAMLTVRGGLEKVELDKIIRFSNANPQLHIRLYRTPMGFRVLLMNDVYSPANDSTVKLLENLNSDSLYVRMCRNQNCFRARVSPKPWRIGIDRLAPRPGVWPIKTERLAERERWVEQYKKQAEQYGACRYLLHLGSDTVHEKAELVRQLHDDLSKACNSKLEIA